MSDVEVKDHMVRGFPDAEYERARDLSRTRRMTLGKYLAGTVRVHERLIKAAGRGDSTARRLLEGTGLERVVEGSRNGS